MFKHNLIATAVALAFAGPALAQDSELGKIREEIKQMKDAYEKRIQTLEKRLSEAEGKAGKAETAATKAESTAVKAEQSAAKAETTAASAGKRQVSENAFNPAVSLILSGTYGNFSQDPARYAITGFVPRPDVGPSGKDPGTRGFSLKESELNIAANIDHYFRGVLLFSMHDDNTVGVEEAYAQTLSLGHGLSIKGGRFFSGLGYQNEIHGHAWDFVDASLVQRAFLGDNYGDDGVQVKWVAPLDSHLLEFGGELGRGKDLGRPAKNGSGASVLFAHFGGDIGTSHAYRLGASTLRSSPQGLPINDIDAFGNTVVNTFSGDSRINGLDFIYKYAPNGNPYYTNFKLQGEYFQRKQDGILTYDTATPPVAGGPIADSYNTKQSGWYLQGVYQFHPYWRAGLRYDRLDGGNVNVGALNAGNVQTFSYNPTRSTAMLDWNPSEFSRLRLQFSQDKSQQGLTSNQVFLQYIYSLGTHGAHKF